MRGPPAPALGVLYILLVVSPLALAAFSAGREASVLAELAVAAGLVALAMLLAQFLSSGRFEWLSGRLGIDHSMQLHQWLARSLIVLVVLHPLLFALARAESAADVLPRLARLFSVPSMASGAWGFGLLLLMVTMALLRRRLGLPYEIWRGTHALLSVATAVLIAHHAFTLGNYSAAPALRAFWWALHIAAIASLAYVYAVKPFVLARRAYVVRANEEVGPGIRSVVLEPAKGRWKAFEAGQFAWVTLGQPPMSVLDHPFSIASSPQALPRIELLIKARGDFTGGLAGLRPGACAHLDMPHGNFTLQDRTGKALVFLAGGIGIAPVMGLLRHLDAVRDRRPISLVHGARSERHLVCADEIRAMQQRLDLQVQLSVDEPSPTWRGGVGEVTPNAVKAALRAAPAECLCFICGPAPMTRAMEKTLLQLGVPPAQIVYELFDYD